MTNREDTEARIGGAAHWHRLGRDFAERAMDEWPMIDWEIAQKAATAFTIADALERGDHRRDA